MVGWMKKVIAAEGITEYPAGVNLRELAKRFGVGGGAVVLAIDVSYSMSEDLPNAVTGARMFVDEAIAGGYEVGLILWSDVVVADIPPSPDPKEVYQLLSTAHVSGSTDIQPALALAGDYLRALEVSDKVIVVFGDGGLGISDVKAGELAGNLLVDGIRIVTMGLGQYAATSLAVISTEGQVSGARVAESNKLAEDVASLTSGLKLRK